MSDPLSSPTPTTREAANPIRCRLFGHSYEKVYVDPMLGFPDVAVIICKRRYCAHILASYTEGANS